MCSRHTVVYAQTNGFLHGDCITCTGKTVAENLAAVPTLAELGDQNVVFPVAKPRAKPGRHIIVLSGNLCPGGSAVSKLSGKRIDAFRGEAIVYDDERVACEDRLLGAPGRCYLPCAPHVTSRTFRLRVAPVTSSQCASRGGSTKLALTLTDPLLPPDAAIQRGDVKEGHVRVIRHEGPAGAPGMPEMLSPGGALIGRGLGEKVALVTDGRFSGVSAAACISLLTTRHPPTSIGGK